MISRQLRLIKAIQAQHTAAFAYKMSTQDGLADPRRAYWQVAQARAAGDARSILKRVIRDDSSMTAWSRETKSDMRRGYAYG